MALRTVIVAPWGERLGGAEEMLWLLLKHRDETRLEPTVVFLSPGPSVEEVSRLGLPAAVIPSGRLRNPADGARTVRRLAALLRDSRPDVVLSWSAKAHVYAAPAAAIARTRARIAWWQHALTDGHLIDRIATALPAQAIGCSSQAALRHQALLRPRRPAFVVNPGIEANGRERPGPELRDQLGIPAGRQVVGIVGRLQPWKGQDRFLAALAELRRQGWDAHGLVVGGTAFDLDPGFAERLRVLVGRLGLEDCVTMTGQVDDATPYFGVMDVAVNASEGEPFGIVLLEAMAAAVPVVAVASGGPLEIVEPGVTGVLARDGSPAALAAAIGPLLEDPARREAMAAAAARSCRERFSAAAMSAQVTEQLAELARGAA